MITKVKRCLDGVAPSEGGCEFGSCLSWRYGISKDRSPACAEPLNPSVLYLHVFGRDELAMDFT